MGSKLRSIINKPSNVIEAGVFFHPLPMRQYTISQQREVSISPCKWVQGNVTIAVFKAPTAIVDGKSGDIVMRID